LTEEVFVPVVTAFVLVGAGSVLAKTVFVLTKTNPVTTGIVFVATGTKDFLIVTKISLAAIKAFLRRKIYFLFTKKRRLTVIAGIYEYKSWYFKSDA
jgi:hypothetical protein